MQNAVEEMIFGRIELPESEVWAEHGPCHTVGPAPDLGELVSIMQTPYVSAMRWSPDGRYLAAASRERFVRIWRLPEDITELGTQERRADKWQLQLVDIGVHRIHDIAWSPDGNTLVIASKNLLFYDLTAGDFNGFIGPWGNAPYTALCWVESLLIAGNKNGTMLRVDARANPRVASELPPSHRSQVLGITHLGPELRFASCSAAYDIRIWDMHAGFHTFELGDHTAEDDPTAVIAHDRYITAVRYVPLEKESSGTQRLVSVSGDGNVRLWDVSNKQHPLLQECKQAHVRAIRDVSISHDARFMITAGMDDTAYLWDLPRWRRIGRSIRRVHFNNLRCSASFHPKENLLASLCDFGTGIRILNLEERFSRLCPHCGFDADRIIEGLTRPDSKGDVVCEGDGCNYIFRSRRLPR
jgi:WD40 repeat protein